MSNQTRVRHPGYQSRIMSAEAAAALIPAGANVGMSGFTGAATPNRFPKRWPGALSGCMPRAKTSASACGPAPLPLQSWTGAWLR